MSKNRKPTDAELEILNILWDLGPSSVREVHNIMTRSRDVYYTTTLKTMQVMVEKGTLERDTSGRSHIYSAAIGRPQVERNLLNTLKESLFKGSSANMIMSALGNTRLSDGELEEIRALIDKMQNDSDD